MAGPESALLRSSLDLLILKALNWGPKHGYAYGVLLRPLPFLAPERLMQVSINLAGTGTAYGSLSAPEYVDLARGTRWFGGVAAWPRGIARSAATAARSASPPSRRPRRSSTCSACAPPWA